MLLPCSIRDSTPRGMPTRRNISIRWSSIAMGLISRLNGSLFEDDERLIPFYVPLKAIDNTKEYPVVRYLRDNNTFLSGKKGVNRLIDLAESRELFLLLDGYDEVPTLPGDNPSKTHFASELQMILQNQDRAVHAPIIGGSYGAFYQAAANCRIWISSRYDFYRMNRVPLFEHSEQPRDGLKTIVAVGLTGVGHNRASLVRNIFGKYRTRNNKYKELLKEEVFLHTIDSSTDKEISGLSNNPLFLTMMCYIYVKEVIDPVDQPIPWMSSISRLIMECVKLLIKDLDEDKARDLSATQQEGLRSRGGRYKEEMEAFLPYFASALIADGNSVFDIGYLRDKLRLFFTRESNSPNASVILESLDNGTPSSDLAQQLIWCGIFVSVDARPKPTYDFPITRFREVLAAKYFEKHPARSELLRAYVDAGHFELIYVLYVASESREKEEILKYILSLTLATSDTRFGLAALGCVLKQSDNRFSNAILRNFIEACIRDNQICFWPKDLLRFLVNDDEFISRVRLELDKAIGTDKQNVIELCLAIIDLLEGGHETVRGLLTNYCAHGKGRILVLLQGLRYGEIDGGVISSMLHDTVASGEFRSALADEVISEKSATVISKVAIPLMSPFEFALFWAKLSTKRRSLAEAIQRNGLVEGNFQGIPQLVDYYKKGRRKLASGCYVIKKNVIDGIKQNQVKKTLLREQGEIFPSEADLASKLGNIRDMTGVDKVRILSECYLGPEICDTVWEAAKAEAKAEAIDVPTPKNVFFEKAT